MVDCVRAAELQRAQVLNLDARGEEGVPQPAERRQTGNLEESIVSNSCDSQIHQHQIIGACSCQLIAFHALSRPVSVPSALRNTALALKLVFTAKASVFTDCDFVDL